MSIPLAGAEGGYFVSSARRVVGGIRETVEPAGDTPQLRELFTHLQNRVVKACSRLGRKLPKPLLYGRTLARIPVEGDGRL